MSNKKIVIVSVIVCLMILGGIVLILGDIFGGSSGQDVVVEPSILNDENSEMEGKHILVNNVAEDGTIGNTTLTETGTVVDEEEDSEWGKLHDIDVQYDILDNGKSKYENFRDLAIEYNKSIPFLADGAWYELGFEKYKAFDYDMYDMCSFGMNSQTYIQWLYLNVFGYVPMELKGNLAARYLESDKKIELSDVCIGDIGLYSDSVQGENHYAVCVGFDADLGVPIFSHMSNAKSGGFVEGNNRMSYAVMEDRIFIGDSAPVELNYFYRLSGLEWE